MELGPNCQTLLRNALTAAERGWHIFPLRPGDKLPAFPDHDDAHCTGRDPRCAGNGSHVKWEPRATTDPGRIRRAWGRVPYNIGIACGPSGLLVVDLDQPKPGTIRPERWQVPGVADGFDVFAALCMEADQTLPVDTYTVTTISGGTHLYYRQPEDVEVRNTCGERGNGLGWLIDTRGHGGYVVAAGSVIGDRAYTVAHATDPAWTPAWIADRLCPAPAPPPDPTVVSLGAGRRNAYLDKAVQASLDAIAAAGGPNRGTLNATVFGAATALGQLVAGGELAAGATEQLLLDAAVRAGHPPAGARKSILSGFRHGARRPRSVAA